MKPLNDEVGNWAEAARAKVRGLDIRSSVEHLGSVERIGDGVITVAGLPETRLQELLRLEDGTMAIAFRVDENHTGGVLIGDAEGVGAGTAVHGTGEIVRVPVGDGLLGRVVGPLGEPLDGLGPVAAASHDPIERRAPEIVDRDLVTIPLMTGVIAIDSMIPLGRGQRELIIGDRKTGKTAVALDAMINQRRSDVICVYASVGQRASTVNKVIEGVRRYGAFERCVFVVGKSEAPPGAQWITPYAACTIAEYFRDRGQHALLIVDDLSKHAIIYRQLSLLLRNPPGREAYPGDIFYIHARLLERAAQLSSDLGGGSLTALPIAETQGGDLSAYIPTNLISITDGQIFLEPKLFYEGQKPAINIGLSVSRVGGQTQPPAIKKLAERLRLNYAQFLELEIFTRFGAASDDRTRATIKHGQRIRATLAQPQFNPLRLADQVALLMAVHEGRLDALPLERIEALRTSVGSALDRHCPGAVNNLERSGSLSDADRAAILAAIDALIGETDISGDSGGDGDDSADGSEGGG